MQVLCNVASTLGPRESIHHMRRGLTRDRCLSLVLGIGAWMRRGRVRAVTPPNSADVGPRAILYSAALLVVGETDLTAIRCLCGQGLAIQLALTFKEGSLVTASSASASLLPSSMTIFIASLRSLSSKLRTTCQGGRLKVVSTPLAVGKRSAATLSPRTKSANCTKWSNFSPCSHVLALRADMQSQA